MRVNPSHPAVTALAHYSKRRAVGRAGYAQRWTDKNDQRTLFLNDVQKEL
jgi:hypothetical protein